jgi:uncharacterized protein (DUF2062 family)
MNLSRKLRYLYIRFIRIRATPEQVARGMAIGLFIGMTPTIPFQMLLAVFVSSLFKENKIAAALGVWITNPITALPIYLFNFKIGRFLVLGRTGNVDKEQVNVIQNLIENGITSESVLNVLEMGWQNLLFLLAGSVVVGLITAVIGFWVTRPLYVYLKNKHISRRIAERAHRIRMRQRQNGM